ncbi:hypothetical protein H6P81_019852 [Aristolochia fimbriata]|uniref:Uncharacterized protein n=1 Tax=Aristolochia fimbriata TaxID=158543 RepID=A0AAV7DSX3_ARIFI|nr:hypothetical protein H6P81_019852 [Aristolochia fimbriata]
MDALKERFEFGVVQQESFMKEKWKRTLFGICFGDPQEQVCQSSHNQKTCFYCKQQGHNKINWPKLAKKKDRSGAGFLELGKVKESGMYVYLGNNQQVTAQGVGTYKMKFASGHFVILSYSDASEMKCVANFECTP